MALYQFKTTKNSAVHLKGESGRGLETVQSTIFEWEMQRKGLYLSVGNAGVAVHECQKIERIIRIRGSGTGSHAVPWGAAISTIKMGYVLVSIKRSWKSSQAKLIRGCQRLNADASLVRIEQCRVVGDADVMMGTVEPVKAGGNAKAGVSAYCLHGGMVMN